MLEVRFYKEFQIEVPCTQDARVLEDFALVLHTVGYESTTRKEEELRQPLHRIL